MNYRFKRHTEQSKTTITWTILILVSLAIGIKSHSERWSYSGQPKNGSSTVYHYENYPSTNNVIQTEDIKVEVSRVYLTDKIFAGLTKEFRHARGKYLVLEVDLTNTSNRTNSSINHGLKVIDNLGRIYERDFSVENDLTWNSKGRFDDGLILPGMTNKDVMVYDILQDANRVFLNYADDWDKEDVNVVLFP